MKNKVLVTGGCGYIGSHTIVDLLDNGFEVISVDNNINSDEQVLKDISAVTDKTVSNYQVDLCDLEKTKAIFPSGRCCRFRRDGRAAGTTRDQQIKR